MRDPVRVYHPDLDATAVVPAKTVPSHQRKGWVLADAPISSEPEEPTTPPSGGIFDPEREGSNS